MSRAYSQEFKILVVGNEVQISSVQDASEWKFISETEATRPKNSVERGTDFIS